MNTKKLKSILTFLLFLGGLLPAFSCSCIGTEFCTYLESLKDDETALIFMGSWVQEEADIGMFGESAIQYKVEEIYYGEIVTENSIHYTGESYINTDSTVWILAGDGSLCFRYLDQSKAIFAVTYNPWDEIGIGYVPSICYPDYFQVSNNNEITGDIWELWENVTLPLTEFVDLLDEGCLGSNTEKPIESNCNVTTYPNPVSETLNIGSKFNCAELELELYDTRGVLVKKVLGSSVSMNDLDAGIYILKSVCGDSSCTKKVVKI